MVSQNFKHNVPPDFLFELLEQICSSKDNENRYIFNKIAFKKGEYLGLIEPFCAGLAPSYHKSRQFYATRKQTFGSFVTVVRHLCKINTIEYTSKIAYDKSNYSIVYFICATESLLAKT